MKATQKWIGNIEAMLQELRTRYSSRDDLESRGLQSNLQLELLCLLDRFKELETTAGRANRRLRFRLMHAHRRAVWSFFLLTQHDDWRL